MEWLLGKKEIKKVALVSYFYETNQTKMLIPDLERHFKRRCCQDYGQVFSTPQGAATPKNFQNPDFSLKWRDFWVFL